MKYFLGISAGFHDAAVSVVNSNGGIEFAAHSERYSRRKNDDTLDSRLISALREWQFDEIAFYERPWMHNLQQIRSGQHRWGPWTARSAVQKHLGGPASVPGQQRARKSSFAHHLSHAAAGFQTSPFDRAAVVVIDAIGELDTVSIYRAWYDHNGHAQYVRCWSQGYPHSLGLFYSAITDHVGLKPMEEEYITMGMAAYGDNRRAAEMMMRFWRDPYQVQSHQNLHIGLGDLWQDTAENTAACAQTVTERIICNIMLKATTLTSEHNLVFMGGVALNCLANRKLGNYFDNIWIMPNPGDAGSSLGAAALAYGSRLDWRDAFLGHRIPGDYPVHDCVHHLLARGIVGVASGRAEFGPRALGNRSLLADPRGSDIKDRVNEIKRRQKFRPFAPAILAEHADRYFAMPRGWKNSDYMQVTARCLRPDDFPAICHVDGTSRVQTVQKDNESGLRRLLEAWYAKTGCPMLLNTSLNVRGEPMVNDRADADRFQECYDVTVCS